MISLVSTRTSAYAAFLDALDQIDAHLAVKQLESLCHIDPDLLVFDPERSLNKEALSKARRNVTVLLSSASSALSLGEAVRTALASLEHTMRIGSTSVC